MLPREMGVRNYCWRRTHEVPLFVFPVGIFGVLAVPQRAAAADLWNRRERIQGVPAPARLVGIDSARHSEQAGNVHEIERQMESDEEEPEMEFTERLVVHLSGHLRKPIIEGAKSREKNAAYDDVMKVGDDEVGIPKLPIEGCRAQHDPGETGDQELKEKGDGEQHRCLEMNLSTPHGRQPVEDLDTRGNSDSHRRENKKRICV